MLEVLDLGATVHALHVTGGDGARRNVLLGHPGPQDHLDSTHYLGGTVGRYANRIRDGRFELDGQEVRVGTNDRGNALHGGPDGFDKRVWTVVEHTGETLELTLHSPDGDQGFPGALTAVARFEVGVEDGESVVRLTLEATTDAPTVCNLTSHAYLNLDGEDAGTIDRQLLRVAADRWLPVDDTGIPVGEPAAVDGTPFDLREPRLLGEVLRDPHPQVVAARGLDHDLVLEGEGLRVVAELLSPATATRLRLVSDQPGLQVYGGNGPRRRRRVDDRPPLPPGRRARPRAPGAPRHPQPARPRLRGAAARETYRSRIEWRTGPLERHADDREPVR